MNKKITKSLMVVSMLYFASLANAQNVTITAPDKVSDGNAFEKEMTPLLREISKKRSQLELRKLDRELSRIDEEELKSQIEMENLTKEDSGSPPVGLPGMGGLPSVGAIPNMGLPTPEALPEKEETNIQVLMIYGFDDNLSAKIASGNQGGYVVKKGDIMPDGKIVTKVTPNFIEIKKNKNAKEIYRLFVSGSDMITEKISDSPSSKESKGKKSKSKSGVEDSNSLNSSIESTVNMKNKQNEMLKK